MRTRFVVAAFVWMMASGFSLWLFFYVTPTIEGTMFPVLSQQSIEIEPGDRTPGRICWTWKWQKNRYARPLVVNWTIHVNGSAVEYQAVTRRERDNSVIRDPQAAPLGPGHNDLCAEIPSTIDGERDLTVRGVVNYAVPHGLWTLWQDMPPVIVPALR